MRGLRPETHDAVIPSQCVQEHQMVEATLIQSSLDLNAHLSQYRRWT